MAAMLVCLGTCKASSNVAQTYMHPTMDVVKLSSIRFSKGSEVYLAGRSPLCSRPAFPPKKLLTLTWQGGIPACLSSLRVPLLWPVVMRGASAYSNVVQSLERPADNVADSGAWFFLGLI